MRRLPTEEEKKLRDIFKPYINGYNEKQPLTSDAPPKLLRLLKNGKNLVCGQTKKQKLCFFETEVIEDEN